MSIEEGRRCAGMTLVELMVAIGIGMIVLAAAGALYLTTTSGFLAQYNYADLDSQSRVSLDQLSRQIRQAASLTSYSVTNLTFLDSDGADLSFSYNPTAKTLTRQKGSRTTLLLSGCETFRFSLFQRNPIGGNSDFVTTTNAAACKLVQIDWSCSREMLRRQAHTEAMVSAKVMIRNKK